MKNFMDRIECVIEPDSTYSHSGEFIEITIRCRSFGDEVRFHKVITTDFITSHFDIIFDEMKEMVKEKFLDGVKES